MREVNNIQQEQLLQLSKKANALQDEIDQLTQLESDLRRMSGASPAQDDGSGNGSGLTNDGTSGQHDGQGGPYAQQPSLDNVSETLDNVAKDIEKRRASLLALQEELKAQQESMGTPGMVSLPGSFVGSTVSVTTPTGWPARGEVSSPYGLRWNGSDFHPGIDIANDMGTPIVATADGTVTTAGWNAGGYGNMVDIDHGNGVTTRYGHAMQVVVSAGQHVRRGRSSPTWAARASRRARTSTTRSASMARRSTRSATSDTRINRMRLCINVFFRVDAGSLFFLHEIETK